MPESPATIRPATLDDAIAIVTMTQHFIRSTSYARFVVIQPLALHQLVQSIVVHGHGVIFVVDTGDELVGMLALFADRNPVTGEPIAEELAWWVEPQYRKSSLGPRLLIRAEQWARDKGCRLLKMVAPVAEPRVGDFYRDCGYEAVETAYVKRF